MLKRIFQIGLLLFVSYTIVDYAGFLEEQHACQIIEEFSGQEEIEEEFEWLNFNHIFPVFSSVLINFYLLHRSYKKPNKNNGYYPVWLRLKKSPSAYLFFLRLKLH